MWTSACCLMAGCTPLIDQSRMWVGLLHPSRARNHHLYLLNGHAQVPMSRRVPAGVRDLPVLRRRLPEAGGDQPHPLVPVPVLLFVLLGPVREPHHVVPARWCPPTAWLPAAVSSAQHVLAESRKHLARRLAVHSPTSVRVAFSARDAGRRINELANMLQPRAFQWRSVAQRTASRPPRER